MNFVDTYLKSKSLEALGALAGMITNVMRPVQGRPATPEVTDAESGVVFPAEPAVGDPEYWYTCVRAPFPVPASSEIEICDPAEGAAVCGVWG